jgi:hypothetical protein
LSAGRRAKQRRRRGGKKGPAPGAKTARIKSSAKPSRGAQQPGQGPQALAIANEVVRFPFRVVGAVLLHAAQILLSIFMVVLHPQFKWLLRLLLRSSLIRNYVNPAIQTLADRLYHPYFDFLRSLPPFWATVSIALPLAILEPAKLVATILIAERPRVGAVLWLLLQGLSFVLIDKTWAAVRPQSRKIWLVSRLHAWIWLNVSYGKYWVKNSKAYQQVYRLLERARAAAMAFLAQFSKPRARTAPARRRTPL